MDILTTALNGIQASQNRTAIAADNLVKAITPVGLPGGQTDSVSISAEAAAAGSSVDFVNAIVDLTAEENVFEANIKVAKIANELTESTLDLFA